MSFQNHKRPFPFDKNDKLFAHHQQVLSQTKAVPWATSAELFAVGRALLDNYIALDLSDIHLPIFFSFEDALEQVAVWKTKCVTLPHAIDSTYSLALVMWRHSSGMVTSSESALAYATSLIRCINGFVDTLQQQRFTAASISFLSGQVGIPAWLVSIRHDATHNQLPSLAVLHTAAMSLLEYLYKVYWKALWDQDKQEKDLADSILEKYLVAARLSLYSMNPVTILTVSSQEPALEQSSSSQIHKNECISDASDEEDDGDFLGSSFNQFAVLQAPPKKKKKENTLPAKKKKPKKTKAKAHKDSPSLMELARQYTTSSVSAPILYERAYAFVLNAADEPVPQSESGIMSLKKAFSPLLLVMTRDFPGFASMMLVHVIDDIIKEASKEELPRSERKLFAWSVWSQYLLSREFLSQIFPTCEMKDDEEIMQNLGFPLHALLDRLQPQQIATHDRLREIASSLHHIVKDEYIPHFGLNLSESSEDKPEKDVFLDSSHETLTAGGCGLAQPANKNKMNLDQIEVLLRHVDASVEAASGGSQGESLGDSYAFIQASNEEEINVQQTEMLETTKSYDHVVKILEDSDSKIIWTLCKHWEPAEIGALPGHPPPFR